MGGPAGIDRILMTGAAGRIGRVLRAALRERYGRVRLLDIAPLGEAAPGEELVQADLRDARAVRAAMEGVQAVVHLGALSDECDWGAIVETNITGTYNVFEAARVVGVPRVVFASSNHVQGFYRRGRRVRVDSPFRPDSRYGVSKVCGEALGRLYADKYGLRVVCLRIGWFGERPTRRRTLAMWISPRDMVQLVCRSLEAPGIHFEVVYGASGNDRGWCDNAGPARRLGYAPQDNSEAYADEVLREHPPEEEGEVERRFQGSRFCAIEFAADPSEID